MTTPKTLTSLPFRLAKGLRAIAAGEYACLQPDEVDRLVAEGLLEPDRKLTGWGCEWVARDRQKSTVVFKGLGSHQIGRREPAAHELASNESLADRAFEDTIAAYEKALARPLGTEFGDHRSRYKNGAVLEIARRALEIRRAG